MSERSVGREGAVVIITAPGHYFLDADIMGEPGRHGIRVVAQGDVSIDLNGFSMRGIPPSINGLEATAPLYITMTVEVYSSETAGRSTIGGWGGDGARTSGVLHCECSRLLVENTGDGFDLSDCVGARLDRCVSSGNVGTGFLLGATLTRGRVSGCSAPAMS